MGRPAKFDQGAAMQIVVDEFWRSGYEACSVKALSEKLGITRSSFYNAFGSREALYKNALQHYFKTAPSKAFTEAKESVSARALITETYREICRTRAADNRGCMAVNGVAELSHIHADLGPLLADVVLASISDIEKLVGWAVTQKQLPTTTDVRAVALALQNLMMGLNVLCKVVSDEADLWATASTTLAGLGLLEHTN